MKISTTAMELLLSGIKSTMTVRNNHLWNGDTAFETYVGIDTSACVLYNGPNIWSIAIEGEMYINIEFA